MEGKSCSQIKRINISKLSVSKIINRFSTFTIIIHPFMPLCVCERECVNQQVGSVIYMKLQRDKYRQGIFKEKNKQEDISTPYQNLLESYTTSFIWQQYTECGSDQWSRIENPKSDMYWYKQLIYDKLGFSEQ